MLDAIFTGFFWMMGVFAAIAFFAHPLAGVGLLMLAGLLWAVTKFRGLRILIGALLAWGAVYWFGSEHPQIVSIALIAALGALTCYVVRGAHREVKLRDEVPEWTEM